MAMAHLQDQPPSNLQAKFFEKDPIPRLGVTYDFVKREYFHICVIRFKILEPAQPVRHLFEVIPPNLLAQRIRNITNGIKIYSGLTSDINLPSVYITDFPILQLFDVFQ